MEIRIDNDFLFASNGRTMGPLIPLVIVNRQQAYRTAAWIRAMAAALPNDPDQKEFTFDQIQEAINNT